jgi:large subunit ribosomal protein L25
MSELLTLAAELRQKSGTGDSRALRAEGKVPAIIYGAGKEVISIALEEKEATKLYRKHGFTSTVIELEINGVKHSVIPKSAQLHPITDLVRHIDFLHLDNDIQKVAIPVVFANKDKSIGLKRGGFLNIIKRKIELYCPVNSIPKNIVVDVERMYVGSNIKLSALTLPEGCKPVSKKDFVVVSITGRGGKSAGSEEASQEAKPAGKK